MTLPGPSHPLVPVIAFPNLLSLNTFSGFSSHSKYRIFVSNATLNGAYMSSPGLSPFLFSCPLLVAAVDGGGGRGDAEADATDVALGLRSATYNLGTGGTSAPVLTDTRSNAGPRSPPVSWALSLLVCPTFN